MKRKISLKSVVWASLIVAGLFVISKSANTDVISLYGKNAIRLIEVFRVTATGDVKISDSSSYTAHDIDSTTGELVIYNGNLKLGGVGTTPSTSSGGYYGLKVPFVNASGQALVQGHLLVWNSSGTAAAKIVGVTSTTTVAGVCDGAVAVGAVGYMTVAGYALVLTTGAVSPGDVIVSSNPTNSGTVLGYGGANAAPTSGTDVGVAMNFGTTGGGLTLIRLR